MISRHGGNQHGFIMPVREFCGKGLAVSPETEAWVKRILKNTENSLIATRTMKEI